MSITELFAVLPYLKTSGPVDVRGIRFRSSKDLDGLPDQTKEHLSSLFSLFFLRINHRISEMVYARLDFTAGAEGFDDALMRLRQAHALIGYLSDECCADGPAPAACAPTSCGTKAAK